MGLDNGLYMRFKNADDYFKFKEIARTNDIASFDDKYYTFDLLYWRKCWNIRKIILDILEAGQEGGDYNVSMNQFSEIADELDNMYDDKEQWDTDYNNGLTIWSYDECAKHYSNQLTDAIINVCVAVNIGLDIELSFYDSY